MLMTVIESHLLRHILALSQHYERQVILSLEYTCISVGSYFLCCYAANEPAGLNKNGSFGFPVTKLRV